MKHILAAAAAFGLALWAAPAAAEGVPVTDTETEPSEPALMSDIGPAEWGEMVRGRTVTYRIGPDFWANETYGRSGNGVAIQLADGTCMEGIWYHTGDAFCFIWPETGTSCFRHVRLGRDILIIPVVDGEPAGTVQTVQGISDTALACGPALTS